jgi:hypothetical protein
MPRKKNTRKSANTRNKILRPSEPRDGQMTLQDLASASRPGKLAGVMLAAAALRRMGER